MIIIVVIERPIQLNLGYGDQPSIDHSLNQEIARSRAHHLTSVGFRFFKSIDRSIDGHSRDVTKAPRYENHNSSIVDVLLGGPPLMIMPPWLRLNVQRV